MTHAALRATAINHVVLHVSDLDRSAEFYATVLGFTDRYPAGGHHVPPARFLRCGVQGLDLFEVDGDAHGGEEMNHMAIDVDADQLDEVVEALRISGIASSEPTPRDSIYIHDPDGHRIELLPRSAHERAHQREIADQASS